MFSKFWRQASVLLEILLKESLDLLKSTGKGPNGVAGNHDPPKKSTSSNNNVKDQLSPILASLIRWVNAAHF